MATQVRIRKISGPHLRKRRHGAGRQGLVSGCLLVLMLALLVPAAQAQLSETKIVASDGADGDFFGEATDIDGNRAVVGVRNADIGNDENAGVAYVFERKNGQWQEVQKLIASNGDDGHFFGESVAIDGDWILVGALGHDDRGGLNCLCRALSLRPKQNKSLPPGNTEV